MQEKSSRCLLIGGESEIVVKKSRFIATFAPVKTNEEAIAFIEQMKKKYWNATHNCYAYVIGEDMQLQRFSDDGEPQGTAGKPMLDVLLSQNVHDVVVVVTRYFGGTLLGTGGLVRAYSQAVSNGLNEVVVIEKLEGEELLIESDYNAFGKVEYFLASRQIPKESADYGENVRLRLFVTKEEARIINKELFDLTNGKISINSVRELKFARNGEKNILL